MQKGFVLQNEGHSFPFIKIHWHLSYIAVKSFFFFFFPLQPQAWYSLWPVLSDFCLVENKGILCFSGGGGGDGGEVL